MIEGVALDCAAGIAQLLPVRHLIDDPGALCAR